MADLDGAVAGGAQVAQKRHDVDAPQPRPRSGMAQYAQHNDKGATEIMTEPQYELFAIRYATREARRSDHFIGGDPHDGPMPMDYFVWVARGGGQTFVMDTGFNQDGRERRKRTFLPGPVEALPLPGARP